MAESRLQRWARKKAEAGKPAEPVPPQSNDPEPSPEEQELALNEALPEQEVLPMCHNLAECTVFGVEKGKKGANEHDLQVWLLTPEDDLKAATSELRFFRQLLGA